MSEPHLEDCSVAQIVEIQSRRLQDLIAAILPSNRFWAERLANAGVSAADLQSPVDLCRLPLCAKQDLVADHTAHPPYGTNLTFEPTRYVRLHQTSGTTGTPLRWLDTPESWNWFLQCWGQIYRMAGLSSEDRLCFPFSFGPFIGFWAAFEGAVRFGNLSLAAGGMTSEARLKMIATNEVTFVCCTPTYAMRLAEVAEAVGIDLAGGPVRGLIVAGEPGGSIPATRAKIESSWGARLFDHWGMTEIGSLAAECVENPGGLHILETECIAEILDPQTLEPVEPGQEGELIITNLGRIGSPLIRYRTGDLVVADPDECPCGRSLLRLRGGILSRADDMVTIRGNNVFPSSLEAILREFPEIAEYRVTVRTQRSMQQLQIEIEPIPAAEPQAGSLLQRVAGTIKERLNFQAGLTAVPAGSLPRFELKGRRFLRENDP